MTRPARVIVDTSALQSNLAVVRKKAPHSKVMSIVKADGYGHGVNRVGNALAASDAFGVASIEEAITLREGGIKNPITLLEGAFEFDELSLIEKLALEPVVHTFEQLQMLLQHKTSIPVWVKIDSGMHRLGFPLADVDSVIRALRANGNPIRCMTHLANAHDLADEITQRQLEKFESVTSTFDGEKSVANSAGILGWPQTWSDWVRPGIMLYGVSPFADQTGAELGLTPVMTVRSQLISVREVPRGGTVGYGRGYVCEQTMPVGVIAFGYGDGYPRAAGTGTPILVKHQLTQVIGEASMDMLTVDLRGISDPKVGDEVTLWGAELPVETVAKAAGTIPYELLCRVRMRARYVES